MSEKDSPFSLLPVLRRAVLALIFAFLLLSTASTSAQTNATLSGRITNGKGEPLPNARAVLYSATDIFAPPYYATANANGIYTLVDIWPDTYQLKFEPPSTLYRGKFYSEQNNGTPSDIVIPSGATFTGYDAVLSNSGRIVGTVVDAGTNPMAGVEVALYRFDGLEYVSQTATETDSSGVFTIVVGYDTPHYLLFTPNEDYFYEYYDNKKEISDANPFTVAAKETITVAVTLRHTQSISGTVVDGHGIPVANVNVELEHYQWGDWYPRLTIATTDANGRYQFEHLPEDYRYVSEYKYRLQFEGNTILDEYYSDQETAGEANIIDLTNGPDTFVANAEVTRRGVVTGTIIDADGAPIEDVAVKFHIFTQGGWHPSRTVYTDDNGYYEMPYGFPDQEYRVEFDTDEIYVTEFYSGSYSVETAQSITIPVETTIPNINAKLDRYGVITGTVTSSTGLPLANVTVSGYDSHTHFSTGIVGSTNNNGYYELRVPPELGVNVSFAHATHEAEFYNDQPSIATALALSVPLNSVLPNINAQLTPGPVISGTVTGSNGVPLEGITIIVLDNEGSLKTTLLTDANGHYSVGLTSGSYRLGFNNFGNQTDNENYVGEYYENAATVEESKLVTLTVGNDLTIDVELTVIPGIIGRVTDHLGQAINANVSLLTRPTPGAEWQCCAYTTTTYEGNYSFRNIEPGAYVVHFDTFLGRYNEYYPNQRTVDTATILTMTEASLYTGIDAVLDGPGRIVGVVINGESEPLAGIEVALYNTSTISSDNLSPHMASTNENGNFEWYVDDGPYWLAFNDPTGEYAGEFYNDQVNPEHATGVTASINSIVTLTVELGAGASITGHVTDLEGQPLEDIIVQLYTYWPQRSIKWHPVEWLYAQTDDQGNYRIDGATPGTIYQVGFSRGMYSYFYPHAEPVANGGGLGSGDDVVITNPLILPNINMALAEPGEVYAAFTGTPRNGTGSLTTNFTDQSLGTVTSRSWNFGDGTTSTQINPSHTYTAPGAYTVTLTVSGTANSDVEQKMSYITLADTPITAVGIQQGNPGGNPQAQPKVGQTIYFSATATGSNVQYLWDFGDDTLATAATASGQYVQHSYDTRGNYTVTLTARNGADEEVITMPITIQDQDDEEPNEEEPVSALVLHGPSRARVNSSITLSATVGAGDNVTYTWNFGDGESATGQTVEHTYSEAGAYTITLTASNSQGDEQATILVVVKHDLLLPKLMR